MNIKLPKLLNRTIFALMIVIIGSTGCSSGPPEDIVKDAISKSYSEVQSGWYKITEYEITNSYTREMDDETVHFLDYVVHFKQNEESAYELPSLDAKEGTISLVKRGDKWYSRN